MSWHVSLLYFISIFSCCIVQYVMMLQCVVSTWAYFNYRIKEDDRMIQNEGVNSLSESELRQACRERGMLGLRSVEDMRKQVILGTA